jgi:hypothetical protein
MTLAWTVTRLHRQPTTHVPRRRGDLVIRDPPTRIVAVAPARPTSMRTLEYALACLAIASAVLIRLVR